MTRGKYPLYPDEPHLGGHYEVVTDPGGAQFRWRWIEEGQEADVAPRWWDSRADALEAAAIDAEATVGDPRAGKRLAGTLRAAATRERRKAPASAGPPPTPLEEPPADDEPLVDVAVRAAYEAATGRAWDDRAGVSTEIRAALVAGVEAVRPALLAAGAAVERRRLAGLVDDGDRGLPLSRGEDRATVVSWLTDPTHGPAAAEPR